MLTCLVVVGLHDVLDFLHDLLVSLKLIALVDFFQLYVVLLILPHFGPLSQDLVLVVGFPLRKVVHLFLDTYELSHFVDILGLNLVFSTLNDRLADLLAILRR